MEGKCTGTHTHKDTHRHRHKRRSMPISTTIHRSYVTFSTQRLHYFDIFDRAYNTDTQYRLMINDLVAKKRKKNLKKPRM